jgi:hypothetical protein
MSDSKILPAASGAPGFRWPDEEQPPRGVKLIVYTSGGVSIISDWWDDSNHIAWSPMLAKPVRRGEPVLLTEEPDHGE